MVADLAPLVRELGMSRFVVSVPGDELTTDASKKPWGHVNVYPLAADASQPRGGAPLVRERLAHEVLEEVRARPGPRSVIQVNHPRSGANGYFDQLGFDPAKGVGTGAGYDAGFDALEVWNGRNVEARTKVLDDFLALLRTSHPVTAIADTDTHGIVGQEAGLPRTYVRVDEGRRARHLGRVTYGRPRAHGPREARRRPHERPLHAGDRQRGGHRRHRQAPGAASST